MTQLNRLRSSHTHTEQLVADNISWDAPDGTHILGPVSLSLGFEKTGLIGDNGIGKSTLAHLLVGQLTPSAGTLTRAGRIGWLPQ